MRSILKYTFTELFDYYSDDLRDNKYYYIRFFLLVLMINIAIVMTLLWDMTGNEQQNFRMWLFLATYLMALFVPTVVIDETPDDQYAKLHSFWNKSKSIVVMLGAIAGLFIFFFSIDYFNSIESEWAMTVGFLLGLFYPYILLLFGLKYYFKMPFDRAHLASYACFVIVSMALIQEFIIYIYRPMIFVVENYSYWGEIWENESLTLLAILGLMFVYSGIIAPFLSKMLHGIAVYNRENNE